MEIRERDNNLLYGCSPRRLLKGFLPQNKDVDLCVESYIYEGHSEKESADLTASDLIKKYSILTSSKISKKSHLIARILKLRERRRNKLKELSIDKRTGEERKTGRGKNTSKPHPQKFDFSEQSSELFNCLVEVAEKDKAFLEDQHGPRKIRLSEQVFVDSILEPIASTSTIVQEERQSGFEPELEEESEEEVTNRNDDPDYVQPKPRIPIGKRINPDLLQLSERFGISAEATANIHNLYSDNKYTAEGVRICKKRARIQAAVPDFSHLKIMALGFDERKDFSLTKNGDLVKEEHCSVVIYSELEGSTFAGHFTPSSGSSIVLANGLVKFCQERKIDLFNLVAVVSDGTVKMTGWKTGVHASLEKHLGRPLQRVVCYSHHLELSFKSIFEIYGGTTTGPVSVGKDWMSLIAGDVHKREIVRFQVIKNSFVESTLEGFSTEIKLSKDHKILVILLKSILTGNVAPGVYRKIGPIHNARFLTTQCRLLRVYMSIEKCSDKMFRMVNFLVNVWTPSFLFSKMFYKKSFLAPKLFLLQVMNGKKFLNDIEIDALNSSLDTNGQMAHHENILLCLLCSDEYDERKMAVDIILKIRQRGAGDDQPLIRDFPPKDYMVNIRASGLDSLNVIPLQYAGTEPPFVMAMSDEQIKSIMDQPLKCSLPLNSVAVERAVKEVTRVSALATDDIERDGSIQQTLNARKSKSCV